MILLPVVMLPPGLPEMRPASWPKNKLLEPLEIFAPATRPTAVLSPAPVTTPPPAATFRSR